MRRCSEPFSACAAWTRWTPTLGGGLTPKKPDLKMKISRSRVEAAIAAIAALKSTVSAKNRPSKMMLCFVLFCFVFHSLTSLATDLPTMS